MIRAYVADEQSVLAVRMTIVQVDDDNEWHATHILRLSGDNPWARTWEAIENEGVEVQPTLTLGHEDAHALYVALERLYGHQPPVILHVDAELTEKQVAEFRRQLKAALASSGTHVRV